MRKIGTVSVKLIYPLLALSFVAFLSIILALWDEPSEQKGGSGATKTEEVQTAVKEEPLTQKQSTAPPFGSKLTSRRGTIVRTPESQNEYPETDAIETMQGKVTIIDWCFRVLKVDDVAFDMGSLDLTGIQRGDVVEISYRKRRGGNVMKSIRVLR